MLPKERSVEQIYFELSGGAVAKNLSANAGDARDPGCRFHVWIEKIPW